MFYWNAERNRFEEVPADEVKRLFQSKEGDCFDSGYNALTFQEFYQPEGGFSEVFWETAYKISSLHRYLEYSRRYIQRYLQEGESYGEKRNADRGTAAEDLIMYSETFYSDREYLPDYNNESVFLMLYTIFENFLRRLAEEKGRENRAELQSFRAGGPAVVRYLKFLNEACGLEIVFPQEVWRRFELLRRIRNAFIHNSGRLPSDGLRRMLKREFPDIVRDERLALGYEFLIGAFETIGAMMYVLEACAAEE